MELLETIAILVGNYWKNFFLAKFDLFRHCETTPGASHGATVGAFGVIRSFGMKLYSRSVLVGAVLEAENGQLVTVMRITNKKYHFRHCETHPLGAKPASPNFTQ